jgi:hypothetical protein
MKLPFTVERRDKPAPVEPKYKWLLPLLVTVAVVVLVGVVVYSIATGVLVG